MKYPYKSVGKIVARFYSNDKHIEKVSTGCIISPKLVITCAHSVFLKK